MVLKKSSTEGSRFEQFEDEFQFKFYRLLPDLKRFALEEPEAATEPQLDKQTMNLKITSTLDELKKKLQKSQSKDQIDSRSEEYIKLICRSQSATFSRSIRKRIAGIILEF